MTDEVEYSLELPKVRTSNGHILDWDRDKVVRQIIKDTQLCDHYYGIPPISEETATEIAISVEEKIQNLDLRHLSAPLVRELVCITLLERGMVEYRNMCARVGMSVPEAHSIDIGMGFEAKDNANLQGNPETAHKKKADKLSKEQALAMLPPHLSEAHMRSDIHIHDLEYFTTRPFCTDWDARYFFYYGLMPDGRGLKASVSGPAMNAEVAVLHLVKVLGSAQCCAAGGQGYYNFLPFLAPYFEGKSEKEIEQLMQMFVYEMTQMMVARGGQSQTYNTPIIIRAKGSIDIVPIGDFCHMYITGAGHVPIPTDYETPSLNRATGELEWKPITNVYVHNPETDVYRVTLWSGKTVEVTSDHSLFSLDASGNFVETTVMDNPSTFVVANNIPNDRLTPLSSDIAWLYGVMIGDGNVIYSHDEIKGISVSVSNETVANRVAEILRSLTQNVIQITRKEKLIEIRCTDPTLGKYFSDIGRGAENKVIPARILAGNESVLKHLLDGLLSTDGYVSRRRYEFCTTSTKLAQQIQFLLLRLGLRFNIRTRDTPGNFNRNFPVHVIQISAASSRDIFVTHSDRQIESCYGPDQNKHDFSILKPLLKREYAHRACGGRLSAVRYAFKSNKRKLKYEDIMALRDSLPGERNIVHKMENILPMEIKTIEKIPYEGFVYDIGVQDNENYVLYNGIIVHNTVFSSVQLSPGVPNLWKDIPVVYKGNIYDGVHAPLRTYGMFEREVRLAFKGIMNVMLAGDYWGKPFNFPKPEIAIQKEFITEDDVFNRANPDVPTYEQLYRMTFELAAKFGSPYYDNMLPEYRNSDNGPQCYQCCAFAFSSNKETDVEYENKMRFTNGAHFAMGGMQVVTINFPRAAYESDGDYNKLIENLKRKMDLAVEVFAIKKRWMDEVVRMDRLPFTTQRPKDPLTGEPGCIAVDIAGLVYIVGILGINETVQYMTGCQLHESKDAMKMAFKIIATLNKYANELSEKLGITINVARTPAETTAQRFAVADMLSSEYSSKARKVVQGNVEQFDRLKYEGTDLPVYYSNGAHLPVKANVPLSVKIDHEHKFFPLVQGGNIFHVFMGEASPDPDGLMEFGMKLAKNTQIGYFAFTRDLTVCLHRYREG